MRKIADDLLLSHGKSGAAKKKKISALLSELDSGSFAKEREDFPISRLHAKLLVIGDSEVLYRVERGEYDI